MIYRKLLKLGNSYHEKVVTSEIVQVAVEGVDQLETYFGAYLPQFFYAMLAPLTLFVYLCFINIPSAVVLLICVPMIPIAIVAVQRWAKKLHSWFINTKLYKNNLESYVQGQGMTWQTKIRIMVTVTLLMSIGLFMMSRVPVGRMILGGVWLFHMIYFTFGVKTKKKMTEDECGC